jgi:hypothetical protein
MDASLYLFFLTRPHSLAYATRVPACSVAHLIWFLFCLGVSNPTIKAQNFSEPSDPNNPTTSFLRPMG